MINFASKCKQSKELAPKRIVSPNDNLYKPILVNDNGYTSIIFNYNSIDNKKKS